VMGIPGLTLYHLKSHLQAFSLQNDQINLCYYNAEKQDCDFMFAS
jgi:hypothetical protein